MSNENDQPEEQTSSELDAQVQTLMENELEVASRSEVRKRAIDLTALGLPRRKVIGKLEAKGVQHFLAYNIVDELATATASGDNGKDESPISGFNWGAFLLTPLWCLFHGRVGTGIALIGWNFISRGAAAFGVGGCAIAGLVTLLVSFHFGSNGYEIAWKQQSHRSVDEFKSRETNWAVSGFILTGLLVLIIFISLGALAG